MYDAAVQIDVPRPAPMAGEDPTAAARGCMLAIAIGLVLTTAVFVWVWWVIQRLLGILGG